MTMMARTLSLLIALAVMAGCAPQPAARLDSLKTPQSPLQLVETIWHFSASGQILDSHLYTVDNLKRAFGGSDVDLQVGKYDVLIGSYAAAIRHFPFETPLQNQTSLGVQRRILHPSGEIQASVFLRFGQLPATIDLATLERLFGKSWIERANPPPPHPIPGPPDYVIQYKFGEEGSGWTASFVLERGGTLKSMVVEMERPKP